MAKISEIFKEQEQQQKANKKSNNKVLNLFNTFLNRNQLIKKFSTKNEEEASGASNSTQQQFRLKRAASTQFSHNGHKSSQLTLSTSSIKMPKNNRQQQIEYEQQQQQQECKRLSLDDKFLDKFENTLISSKNSGLIFVPPPLPPATSQQEYATVNDNIYEKLNNSSLNQTNNKEIILPIKNNLFLQQSQKFATINNVSPITRSNTSINKNQLYSYNKLNQNNNDYDLNKQMTTKSKQKKKNFFYFYIRRRKRIICGL